LFWALTKYQNVSKALKFNDLSAFSFRENFIKYP